MAIGLSIELCFFTIAFVGIGSLHTIEGRRSRRPRCDNRAIRKCLAKLDYMTPHTGYGLELVQTQDNLDKLCTDMNTALQCVNNHVDNCRVKRVIQMAIDTDVGIRDYICNSEGGQLLLSETSCWDNPAFETNMKFCEEHGFTQVATSDDYCGILESMLDCGRIMTQALCGARAAEFFERYTYLLEEPAAEYLLDCELRLRNTREALRKFSSRRRK